MTLYYPTLSIQQPYAWAIVNGFKKVENRTWATNVRGWIVIHAGKKELRDDVEDVIELVSYQIEKPFDIVMDQYQKEKALGALVGCAMLVDCVTSMDDEWFFGPYGFVLKDAKPCHPIPYKGKLGFFNVSNEVFTNQKRSNPNDND